MIRRRGTLSPDVLAFLDEERSVPAMPATARARAIARAHAALVADGVAPPLGAAPRARRAASVALACVVSTVAIMTVYGNRAHSAHPLAPAAAPPATARIPLLAVSKEPDAPETFAPAGGEDHRPAARVRRPPLLLAADAVRTELRLLRRAQAAVARQDFTAGLSLIAEHRRRFRDGRLAEEREALHVKALVGLGRAGHARRAASSFRRRFPNSVLLPAVCEILAVPRQSAEGPSHRE